MPKKKKTQLKPVARGFATTSVPKKAAVADTVDASDDGVNDAPSTSTPAQDDTPTTNTEPVPELSPEEHFIQDWVTKNQDRVEREIQRALKALEVDRRFAKTHLPLELDPEFQDQILKLVAEESAGPKDSVEDDEDKALLRLGITYGILMRVGLPQDVVEECIRGMGGVDLEDATTWFTLNRPDVNLGEVIDAPSTRGRLFACSYSAVPPSPKVAAIEVQPAPPTETQPAQEQEPPLPARIDAVEPTEQPPTKSGFWGGDESESEPDSEDDDLDLDPNLHYAQLKVRIYTVEIAQKRRIRKDAAADIALQTLRDRLAKVKQNYLFREKEAEALYRAEKMKADAAAKSARLRGPPSAPAATSRKQGKTSQATSEVPTAAPSEPTAGSESGDGSLLGGFFEASGGESPASTSVAIAVRDMALPKLWTGRTPQLQLRDTVSQLDKFALVSFARVGGTSRIARASCTIRWSDSKVDHWEMKEVGCTDEAQANNFISVVGLHALSSEIAAGFATGGTSASAKIFSFVRLLPTAYRDLWDELEQQRIKQEEAQNRSAWTTLRGALNGKLAAPSKVAVAKASRADDKQTSSKPKQRSQQGPSGEQIKEDWASRKARPEYRFMEAQRSQLPISSYRQDILRLLDFSQVCVLSGETGCGKSSQLPQFILQEQLEQGRHCNIICTEPRRISAISLAQRVSQELGEPSGAVGSVASLVGYSIRLESNTSRTTRLTYMTNGIALRMLENGGGGGGTSFDEVTHIIIDEVHERSIESDFLLIVLKSLLPRRPDLRIVLMSATLDAEKISNYFDKCPTIHVPGRTFPVRVSYLEDALELSGWVVSENSPYARDARAALRAKDKERQDPGLLADDDDIEVDSSVLAEKVYSRATLDSLGRLNERLIPMELIMRLLETICWKNQDYVPFSAAVLVFMPGIAEIRQLIDLLGEHAVFGDESQFVVLPLHSTLSSQDQSDVFNIPPPGIRKIVVSTNIAETGVTIPDITCVIDSGKHREMRYDEKRQLSRLVDTFITKSNAAQRRGRAGRVREGLSFHLFSKHRHDTQMMENPQPEMLRLSLASLALRIKITNVALGSSIENVFLNALDPPSQLNIQRAINSLVEVGALTSSENITPLGQLLSKLPIDVHLGKLLAVAANLGCLDPALTVAATLSNGKSAFVTPFGQEQEADRAKQTFNLENNDFLTMHNVYASWRRACGNTGFARKFVRQHFLSHQALQQIEELRQQLLRYLIDASLVEADRDLIRDLNRSRGGRARTNFISVPVGADRNSEDLGVVQAAIAAGLWPKVICLAKEGTTVQMKTLGNSQVVAFHPTSVNFQRPPRDFAVNFLAYFTLMQSRRLYAWETGAVHDLPVAILCGDGDYKAATETLTLDRSKIRYRLTPRSGIALQHLRQRVASGFASKMRGKQLKDSEKRWMDLAVQVLRRKRADDPLQIGISR